MCGIGGVLGDQAGIDRRGLREALRHRGPDDEGEHAPHPELWLCATRLALREAGPGGAQPMREGGRTLVFNGEIYNTAALAAVLGQDAPGSRSDTALLLAAHRRWGADMVDHLEGMFALALWDEREQTLLLARDPVGMKPLWLARGPRRLAFASEVRALLRSGAVPSRLDAEAVDAYLAGGSPPEPAAIVAGVEALPPGAVEILRLDRSARRRAAPSPRRTPVGAATVEGVGARLRTAVEQHLLADSEVGLLLSGGIDSGALGVLVSSLGGGRHAFHVRTDPQEAAIAATRAQRLGLRYVEVDPREGDTDVVEGWLAAQDQPCVDGLNTWVVARAIRREGIKAALSGVGGDEVFLGYPFYRTAERLARHRGARQALAWPARLLAPLQAQLLVRGGRLSGGWRVAKALDVLGGQLPAEVALRRLFPRAVRERLGARGAERAEPGPGGGLDAAARDLRGYVVDTLLRDADLMGMAHGVELRVPFLDRELSALVAGMPAARRLEGEPKALLLDAVPELRALPCAAKRGFELPAERILRGSAGEVLRELATDRVLVEGCGLDRGAVLSLVQAPVDRASAFRALALGSLLAWARRHGASL